MMRFSSTLHSLRTLSSCGDWHVVDGFVGYRFFAGPGVVRASVT